MKKNEAERKLAEIKTLVIASATNGDPQVYAKILAIIDRREHCEEKRA
jgi:hypothetical protein